MRKYYGVFTKSGIAHSMQGMPQLFKSEKQARMAIPLCDGYRLTVCEVTIKKVKP